MMQTLNCPYCDEEHTLDEHQVCVFCNGRDRELWLEADGEFRDVLWRDKSRLICYESDHSMQAVAALNPASDNGVELFFDRVTEDARRAEFWRAILVWSIWCTVLLGSGIL